MTSFLRRLWTFVRPYRTRLILGSFCGVLFGLSNALLIAAIKVVVNLVFTGSADLSQFVEKSRMWKRLVDALVPLFPQIKSPESRVGLVLVIGLVPLIMLARGTCAYLNIYLTNWAASRAIADLRTTLFAHLQNLSLSFFSRARTGDLISRVTNDTQILYGIVGNSFASIIRDPR